MQAAAEVFEHHDELVAAKTGHGIASRTQATSRDATWDSS
jgi:hypothetical protein